MSTTKRSLTSDEKHVYEVLRSTRFLKMEGLGNEVPFFIYHYPTAVGARRRRPPKKRVNTKLGSDDGIERRRDQPLRPCRRAAQGTWRLGSRPRAGAGQDKADFREMLQGMLDPQLTSRRPSAPRLDARADFDIFFLTGIGEVFPFIRSHNVLNNLQSVVTGKPMLMFFPGRYEQSDVGLIARAVRTLSTDDQLLPRQGHPGTGSVTR